MANVRRRRRQNSVVLTSSVRNLYSLLTFSYDIRLSLFVLINVTCANFPCHGLKKVIQNEPQPLVERTENLVKFGHPVFEMPADGQTNIHTDMLITVLRALHAAVVRFVMDLDIGV